MWATMQKLRMRVWSKADLAYAVPLLQSAAVANIKSQIKRNRQNEGRRLRNKAIRSGLKSSARSVRAQEEQKDVESGKAEIRRAVRQIDKAVSKGAIHKRAAARRKSRLTRAINARGQTATSEASG
jgi:small subunit ribosomal protein S20